MISILDPLSTKLPESVTKTGIWKGCIRYKSSKWLSIVNFECLKSIVFHSLYKIISKNPAKQNRLVTVHAFVANHLLVEIKHCVWIIKLNCLYTYLMQLPQMPAEATVERKTPSTHHLKEWSGVEEGLEGDMVELLILDNPLFSFLSTSTGHLTLKISSQSEQVCTISAF